MQFKEGKVCLGSELQGTQPIMLSKSWHKNRKLLLSLHLSQETTVCCSSAPPHFCTVRGIADPKPELLRGWRAWPPQAPDSNILSTSQYMFFLSLSLLTDTLFNVFDELINMVYLTNSCNSRLIKGFLTIRRVTRQHFFAIFRN